MSSPTAGSLASTPSAVSEPERPGQRRQDRHQPGCSLQELESLCRSRATGVGQPQRPRGRLGQIARFPVASFQAINLRKGIHRIGDSGRRSGSRSRRRSSACRYRYEEGRQTEPRALALVNVETHPDELLRAAILRNVGNAAAGGKVQDALGYFAQSEQRFQHLQAKQRCAKQRCG